MLDSITKILEMLVKLFGYYIKPKTSDESMLEEDKQLADAIKNGDTETVERIRERRRKYPNVVPIILLGVLLFTGCSMFHHPKLSDIPLTEGDVPYVLPAGEYKDIKGQIHNEKAVRWSLSEADVYKSTKEIKPVEEKKNKFLTVINKYPKTSAGTIVLIIAGLLMILRKPKDISKIRCRNGK